MMVNRGTKLILTNFSANSGCSSAKKYTCNQTIDQSGIHDLLSYGSSLNDGITRLQKNQLTSIILVPLIRLNIRSYVNRKRKQGACHLLQKALLSAFLYEIQTVELQ